MTDDTYTLTLAVFDSGEARSKLRGDTRRSLWRLIEWARARDTHSRPHEDERVPTGWP
jgi:hypothetical protein